jgi:hypothetical protein
MTMHLLPVYYTTTQHKRKSKSKPTTKLISKHDQWLLDKGLHPSQIKVKKDTKLLKKQAFQEVKESLHVDRSDYTSSGLESIASPCIDRSLMKRLHNEPEHVRKEILSKASRVMPLFNKGGLQYLTDGEDLKTVGTKSRRN